MKEPLPSFGPRSGEYKGELIDLEGFFLKGEDLLKDYDKNLNYS